jgi:hypothetical protein
MSKSIAGAIRTGQDADKYVAISKLLHIAFDIEDKLFDVAGAISKTSAQFPKSTWLFHFGLS